jgi:Alr-MurF fusion protein
MIMNPEQSSFGLLLQYRLEPEIYSFNILHAFAEYADKQGVKNFPIHIKIDTGMHRLGFSPEEIDELIKDLSKMPSVKVDSAFSHLAAADDPNMDTFTLNQIDAFMNATDKLRANLKYPFLRHILNSYGVQRFDKYQFEMVRLGIGLYGIGFNEKSDIKNIATLKTVILQIKHIKQDETIGYNRKGVLVRDTTIAAIPIGYADGLNRAFGNRNGYAIVNDKPAPFIGNICMDVCMIDITDIPNVKEGDSVTIFGDDLTISDLAQKTHTIPYEILTGISLRVKRVYFQE